MNKWDEMLRYLDYLETTFGYSISIKDFMGFIPKDIEIFRALNQYYIHDLPFCLYVKAIGQPFDDCQQNTRRLEQRCREQREPFIGACWCGMYELIVPVYFENTLLAAICVGGFDYDRERSFTRMEHALGGGPDLLRAQRFFLQSVSSFDCSSVDWETVKTHIGVLSGQLRLTYLLMAEQGLIAPHKQYSNCAVRLWTLSHMLEYIQEHYTERLTLTQVCEHFRYSSSYVSHTFNRFMGMNFNSYINKLRVQKAREIMLQEKVSVTELALRCGFSDPNYFSCIFKKQTGYSPSAYRRHLLEEGGQEGA